MPSKLLIVEDEFIISKDLYDIVTALGYGVMGVAKSAEETINLLNQECPDIILLDINIKGKINGIALAKLIDEDYQIPYIYITSYSDDSTLKEVKKTNPLGYVLKPFNSKNIMIALEIAFLNINRTINNSSTLKKEEILCPKIIGNSKEIKIVLHKIENIAMTDVTVLLSGETGTGKEVIADTIHRQSSRAKKEMVKVNCAALPKELLESILFGHTKGSFTGATQQRIGKIEAATGSTIFLDEIAEIPLESQPKLLRFLQEKEIEVIGQTSAKKIDVRILAATNKNLADEVQKGNFREDLFYRLNMFTIKIPPLRDRKSDLNVFIEFFLKKFTKKYNKKVTRLTKNTLEHFQNYSWPGNIRELGHVIEKEVILVNNQETDININLEQMVLNNSLHTDQNISSLEDSERSQIIKALRLCKGKIRGRDGAAKLLGTHPNTLDSKIKKLHISKKQFYY